MSLNLWRMAGVALVALGLILFIAGLSASHSTAEQVSMNLTGRFSAGAVWCIILGIVAGLPGVLLVMYGGKGKSSRVPQRKHHFR